MNKEQKIFIGIGAAITAVGLFMYIRKEKKSTLEKTTVGKLNEDVFVDSSKFPLENGSKGDEVMIIQKFLNLSDNCKSKAAPKANERSIPLYPLEEDGIFGDKTEAILQRCYGTSSVNESTYINMKKGVDKMTIKA